MCFSYFPSSLKIFIFNNSPKGFAVILVVICRHILLCLNLFIVSYTIRSNCSPYEKGKWGWSICLLSSIETIPHQINSSMFPQNSLLLRDKEKYHLMSSTPSSISSLNYVFPNFKGLFFLLKSFKINSYHICYLLIFLKLKITITFQFLLQNSKCKYLSWYTYSVELGWRIHLIFCSVFQYADTGTHTL